MRQSTPPARVATAARRKLRRAFAVAGLLTLAGCWRHRPRPCRVRPCSSPAHPPPNHRGGIHVVDPVKSVIAIEDYRRGTSEIAQTTLRSVLGQIDLDELLVKRDEINQRLQRIIDDLTNPWGVKVTVVEVKDVELPDVMRRAMARQAEAERDRRAKVIHAHGEMEAAETLGQAAGVLERHPAAMQLRVLSTMAEVSAERNSTLIFPLPMELLRLVDAIRGASGTAPNGSAQDGAERPPAVPADGDPAAA
jgi:SPFH domain / Band 7 family